MQARIEQHPDYETKLKNDPIAVLEAIKTLMHNSVRAQYPIVTVTDALGRLMNVRQLENESLLDYVKRFKQLRDVVASQMGTKFLDEFVEHQTLYPVAVTAKKKTMKTEAYSRWMAYLLLRGSDQRKYGSLLTGFTSQFSLGNNQYPKTIMTTCDVLSNHKIDERFYTMMKRKNNERQSTERLSSENDDSSQASKSFAQQKSAMICYCCGKEGHRSNHCEQRSVIPREEWYIKQAIQNLQEIDNEPNEDELIDDAESVPTTTTTSSSTSSQNRRSGATRPARRESESRDIITWSG